MGISSSEIFVMLRARDEASRILRGLGGSIRGLDADVAAAATSAQTRGLALASIGSGIAASGVAGMMALDDMTSAAIEYNKAAALTETQLDGVNLSLEDLKEMGLQTARELPVAFEQIQPALYDIFSSIETDAPGAEKLLRGIGVAAVAGSVDMETAGRANIAILNAWKKPAEEITEVNDVMFQLVRKGVGTYDEFGKSIGKSIPSAVRMGQNVEDLSGAMAFMTRNGLSASMASTSVARAMDAMTKPKAQENLAKLGVQVTDTEGKFRPFADIMGEMRDKLANLDPAARAVKLQEIFKGSGGTIQAMRVFNLGIEDSNGLLQQLSSDMYNAEGAAKEAYDIMADTPEAKLQQMTNQYEAMRAELGDKLLPIKLKLVEAITQVLDWFSNLSPEVKDIIAKSALLGSVLLIVVGAIVAVVGVVLMMSAAMAVAGVGIGAVIAVVGGVAVGIAALIAVVVLVIKYWDQIKAVAISTWNAIWNAIKPFVDWLVGFFVDVWNDIVDSVTKAWETFGPRIMGPLNDVWDVIMRFVGQIRDAFAKFGEMAEPFVAAMKNIGIVISTFWNSVVVPVLEKVVHYVGGILVAAWEFLWTVIKRVFDFIGTIITGFIDLVRNFIGLIVSIFAGDWAGAWEYAKALVVDFVTAIVNSFMSLAGGVIEIVVSLANTIGHWFANLVKGVVDIIVTFVTSVIDWFVELWDVLVGNSIVPDMVNAIIDWFVNLWNTVSAGVSNFVQGIIDWFVNLWNTVVNGVTNFVNSVVNWFTNLYNSVTSSVSNLVNGVINGFSTMYNNVANWIRNLVNNVVTGFTNFVNKAVSIAQQLPNKVISAVNGLISRISTFVKTVANNFVNGLLDMVNRAVSTVRELPGKVVSALGDLGGHLVNSGMSLINGFINGIKQGFNSARQAVSNGIQSIRDFFPFSPAKKGPLKGKGYTDRSGIALMRDFGAGIKVGSKYSSAAMVKAAADMVKSIRTLQTDMSKLLKRDFGQAILFGNADQTNKMLYKSIDMVNKVKTKRTQALANYIESERKQMVKLADQRTKLGKQLDDLDKKLAKQVEDRAKYVQKIYEKNYDLSGTLEAKTSKDMIANMRKQVDATKKFRSDMDKLAKMGLSRDMLAEFAEAGAEKGGAAAAALLAGGPKAVKEVNVLSGQLARESNKLGNTLGDQMYKAGIDSTKGLIAGIKAQEAAVIKEANALANKIAGTIKKALRIKSPSRVLRKLGEFTGIGLAIGLKDTTGDVVKQASAMAEAASDAVDRNLILNTNAGLRAAALANSIKQPSANSASERLTTNETVVVKLDPETLWLLEQAMGRSLSEYGGDTNVEQDITVTVDAGDLEEITKLIKYIKRLGYNARVKGA